MSERPRLLDGPKAIETEYNGYRFRSRLEARWAVFFDYVGVTWSYEEEGYEFPDRTRYLPDFYLPGWQAWVEVKPNIEEMSVDQKREALDKANRLFEAVQPKRVLLLCGPPDVARYVVIVYLPELVGRTDRDWPAIWVSQFENCARCGALCLDLYGDDVPDVVRAGGLLRPLGLKPPFSTCTHDAGYLGEPGPANRGLEAARQARFEHGERGAPRR